MAKRVATSDLNHDNWDQEEKPEEAGSFRKADESAMQSRVIRQAKRRSTSSPYSSADPGERKNVFANFSGFKTSSSTAIGSFSFGGAGAATAIGSTNATEASVAAAPASLKFGGAATVVSQVNSSAAEAPMTVSNRVYGLSKKYEAATENENGLRESKYVNMPEGFSRELQDLNIAFCNWMASQVKNSALCVLSPMFDDYEEHLALIVEKYSEEQAKIAELKSKEPNKIDTPPVATKEPAVQKTFSFNFGASTSKGNINSDGYGSSVITGFGDKQADKKSEKSHTRTSSGPNIFGHSFASPVQPQAGIPADNNKTEPQFSFGSEKPFTFANVPKPAGASEENDAKDKDESDEPPKVEFTPVVEKDAFFSQRCKVFVKKGGSYQDRGVGTLYLKPVSNSSKTQLIVRADTSLGNVLLNTLLFKSMPLQRMGNNNVMMVCIPTPEAEPPPIPILLRVKTAEEADSLLKKLKEHVK